MLNCEKSINFATRKIMVCLMRRYLLLVVMTMLSLSVVAETVVERDSLKHEVRVGWGDQMFESLIWQVTSPIVVYPENIVINPGNFIQSRNEQFTYTQHWFAEYQYRVNHWFGAGLMLDGSGVLWKNVVRDGYGNVKETTNHDFYNILILPTCRFTYCNIKYLSLYSAVGVGLDINGGTESNEYGKKTDFSAAFSLTLLGISANYQRWFWTFEFGGAYALKGQNDVFLLSSRMFTLSLGVRI